MATNIIVAKFCADQTRAWTDELWQYDYGQILKFDGLELPDAYEVHFSNQPLTGETITQIGTADGVTIPDQFLQSGEVVYAWVYLHAGEDDGETEYMVTIPVSKRPEPSDEQPTPVEQSAIDQAIAALNIAVEKADEAITHYPQIQSGTWWVWDVTEEEYVDTEVEARGPHGIQGIPGQDGEDGAPGAPGEDGFSPEITVQDITGGHRITITDATGTKTVDVMDGEDGQPGQPGATGNGIASITKTGTVGLVDTYTITYTNGTTTTFTVTNGSDATVTVDDELSSTSENPVQNKVINSALSDLTDDLNHISEEIIKEGSENLYSYRSADMTLSINETSFGQGSTLYGFYIPIDPNKGTTITIKRDLRGKRFRAVACHDVPAVGTTFSSSKRKPIDGASNTIVYDLVEPTDRYLYIAYYSSTQDTYTKEQLLAGMTIFYGTEYVEGYNRLDRLDSPKSVPFTNEYVNSSGEVIASQNHILSDFIDVNGRFGISCHSDYVITVNTYNNEEEYISYVTVTDQVKYISNDGKIRVCIEASDSSAITPETVDFSQIKMPGTVYSAYEYTNAKTKVLDAENCKINDVYAYIDEAVSAHGMYATKNLLCTETSGLPIYDYVLGNGNKIIVIISGQHGPSTDGDPRDSVISVAKMMHDLICGEFSNDSILKTIHDECTLVVVPILNPYGFNNGTRTNANGIDLNRDWTSGSTIEVSTAKGLITVTDPFMVLDVHCNGTTPVANADVEIQFGLGTTHNPLFKTAVQPYFKSYYNTDVESRTPNTTDTLQYYIQSVINKLGGLLELRWWIKSKKWFHDSQAESADYAMIANAIKYCYSVDGSETYEFEHTPNQNQY